MNATFETTGDNHEQVLSEMNRRANAVREQAAALEGLENFALQTLDLAITPMCEGRETTNDLWNRRSQVCEQTGFIARQEIVITANPPEISGNMVSLVSELGAQSARISEFDIRDPAQLEQQAYRNAVQVARVQAGILAEAAEARLGEAIELRPSQNAQFFGGMIESEMHEVVEVTRSTPATPLDIDQGPVRRGVTLTVTFELLPVADGDNDGADE